MLDLAYTFLYSDGGYLRTAKTQKFQVQYSMLSKMSLIQALSHRVHQVVAQAAEVNKTPCIFYSGGLDSELLIHLFIQNGYRPREDFVVCHMIYDDAKNEQDTQYAKELDSRLALGTIWKNQEATSWYLSQECFDYCVTNNISYVTMTQVTRLMSWANENSLFPVIGHGDPQVILKNGVPHHVDFEYQVTWEKFCRHNSLDACVSFFKGRYVYPAYLLDIWKRIENALNSYPELVWLKPHDSKLKREIFGDLSGSARLKLTGHEAFRTEDITQVNLRLQEHTGYTYMSAISTPLRDFILDQGLKI